MGSAWHTREEGPKREWVLFAAGAIVLLVLAGVGAGIGVAVSKRSGEGGTPPSSGTTAAVAAAAPRPLPPANVAEQSVRAPPPPAAAQPARPPPYSPALAPPSPSQGSPKPPPPAPKMLSPPLPPPPTSSKPPPPPPSTYDSSYIAAATGNNVPPAPGFVPVVVTAPFEGTCALRNGMQYLCNDGMTGTVDQTNYTVYKLMHDPTQMEACGFADMRQIANSLVAWAYKSRCGVEAFTIVRACVGIPGGAGQGHWRARIMLWPKAGSTDPTCIPLCLKIRGNANTLTDYGRHGSCNDKAA